MNRDLLTVVMQSDTSILIRVFLHNTLMGVYIVKM